MTYRTILALSMASALAVISTGVAHRDKSERHDQRRGAWYLLAAERPCNLHFDLTAVQRYIASHVSEDDMSFGSFLQTMVEGRGIEMRSMTPGHSGGSVCADDAVAKFNGFIQ